MSIASGAMWTLPGPAAFVRAVCDELYRTHALALTAPGAAVGLGGAIERRLIEDGRLRVVAVVPRSDEPAVAAIGRVLGLPGAAPAALATACELEDTVAVLMWDATEPVEADLAMLARMAAASRRTPSFALAVVGGGAFEGLPQTRDVRGIVSPLDAGAYVAGLPLAYGAFEQRLVVAVAIEVSAWDIELLDRLAGLPIEKAVRPDAHVADWSDGRDRTWSGRPESWHEGSRELWCEEECAHPLWLAVNRPHGLRQRVWRGQVGVLLPWLEGRRQTVIEAYRSRLRPDPLSGPEVQLLEWGSLVHQIAPGPQAPPVQSLRFMRNELAHGRPVPWTRIKRTRDEWDAWLARGPRPGSTARR